MKNKQTKLLSIKDSLKINIRAFKLIFKKYPKMIISRFINVIVTSLTPYVGIYLSALIISELSGERNKDRLMSLVLISLISAAIISLIQSILGQWSRVESAGFYFKIRKIFTEKLLDMDFVSVDDSYTHELLSKINQNQNSGGWGLNRVVGHFEGILSALLSISAGSLLTFSLFSSKVPNTSGNLVILNNPIFIFIVILVMIIVTYTSPRLSTKAGSYWAVNAESHNIGNRLFGFFGFLGYKKDIATDVRIYRQDKLCYKYNSDKHSVFGPKGLFARFAKGPVGLLYASSSIVSVIFTGVVYLFVCIKAWAKAFGIGKVTQYIASISTLSGSFRSLISKIGDMRNNAPFLKQVFEFLDIPNTMYQGSLTVEKRNDKKYEIEFKNVSFRYPNTDFYALKNVSIKFEIGKSLAVVGVNGSGKTTFIKLLCRLYDPTEGEILLNGINIKKYNYLEYMNIFSIVFQDFKLFSFTLGENIATKINYDVENVKNHLYQAGFGDRFEKLEDGLNSYLYKDLNKKGIDVSGGEAQKIALARALYKDAPFIVLDEPTSALDPIAEAEVYSKFNDIVQDKTAIYISHRLSSCRFCDNIIVFDNGEIVQKGTHETLVSDKKGKFFELWNAQAQYYK